MTNTDGKVSFGEHGLADKLWLDIPLVVLVGHQSSGKSSVLERIVGKDFLPKGPRLVTKRPIVVELHKIDMGQQEFALLQHRPERIMDFETIRKKIKAAFGDGQTPISSSPVSISIYSPNVFNAKLVDLPGLVDGGDSQQQLAKEIKELIRIYIAEPTCTIMAITPASVDSEHSDAVKLALEKDPLGVRSFTVFTKVDLVAFTALLSAQR